MAVISPTNKTSIMDFLLLVDWLRPMQRWPDAMAWMMRAKDAGQKRALEWVRIVMYIAAALMVPELAQIMRGICFSATLTMRGEALLPSRSFPL